MAPGLLTPRQAAQMLGVSYVTLKGWILRGSIATVKTPGGHHRIEPAELEKIRGMDEAPPARTPGLSGRNRLVGVITEVTIEGLLARVRIRLGTQQVTAIITSEAVREMKLGIGQRAAALIKATEVMVARVDAAE